MPRLDVPSSLVSFFQKHKPFFKYGFLSLPIAFAGLPLYVHMPNFYHESFGLNLALMGGLLFFIRAVDAIQDPFIGYVSDLHAKKRRLIMKIGAGILTVGMLGLCQGPVGGVSAGVWFFLSMILATTGVSLLSINLTAIGALGNDPLKKSAFRESFGLIGVLFASVMPAILSLRYSSEWTFQWVFFVFLMMMGLGFFLFQNQENQKQPEAKESFKLKDFFHIFSKNGLFFLVYFLSQLAVAFPAVLVLFFIKDYLHLETFSGLFLCLYFLSGACLMPLWVKLSSVIGHGKAWLMAMGMTVLTFIWVYFLLPGGFLGYSIVCVLSGLALGAELSIPPTLLASYVKKTQLSQAYSLMHVISKLALAMASMVAFIILDHLGYPKGIHGLQGLRILYGIVPCVIKGVAAVLWWKTMKGMVK